MQVEGPWTELPTGLDLTAYRIVQESLTNILKHSGAAHVTVRLSFTSSSLQIDVADDGMRTPTDDDSHGHGLVGIAERVALFGGTARAGPGPSGGWHVHAELPLPARSRQAQPGAAP